MSSIHDNRASALVEYEAAALKLALYYLLLEEALDARSEEMDPEIAAFCERSDKQIITALRKRENALRRKAAIRRIVPLAAKAAIYLVLIGNLAASIAFAGSATVRARVMKFFEQDYETHTTVGFVETGESLDIPADWTAPYYPAYIPEGFSLTNITSVEDKLRATFSDAQNNIIRFSICNDNTDIHINTEGKIKRNVRVQGIDETLYEGEYDRYLVWLNGELSYIIYTTLPSEECRLIADSMSLIDR